MVRDFVGRMAAHTVSPTKLAAAFADVAAGATLAEASEAHGIGLATLRRYRNGYGPRKVATSPAAAPVAGARSGVSKAPRGVQGGKRVGREAPIPSGAAPPSSPVQESLAAEGDVPDETLVAMLRVELRHAITARRKATAKSMPGAEARWSKRVEELVRAVERLTPMPPAPPPPPDVVTATLRQLDGETIALIERFLSDRIEPKEFAA